MVIFSDEINQTTINTLLKGAYENINGSAQDIVLVGEHFNINEVDVYVIASR